MPLNIGYITSDRTTKGDELFTPDYAVNIIKSYIPNNIQTIWCPFDTEDSNYVKILSNNYNIIASHLVEGEDKDFFKYTPNNFDCIISNPPFSKKFEVLDRLIKLNKPFAIIWPLPGIQSQRHFDLISQCQLLIFDKRIKFYKEPDFSDTPGSPAFASIYLCKDFLTKDIIFQQI